MAVLKCKMCGGQLNIDENTSVIECEYCGSKQTISNSSDEETQNLLNRANTLRLRCEFDKAEAVYERILSLNNEEPEAYWGVILCKFGVEYVVDPKTNKRIPTCHRTSYDSIVSDEYYKNCIKYCDVVQRNIYEAEAKLIDEIQKNILTISANEKPYDVFICYKETDETGKRTKDSVIANDIYYELTENDGLPQCIFIFNDNGNLYLFEANFKNEEYVIWRGYLLHSPILSYNSYSFDSVINWPEFIGDSYNLSFGERRYSFVFEYNKFKEIF